MVVFFKFLKCCLMELNQMVANLQEKRFCLGIRKKLLMVRVVQQWNRFLKEMVGSLETFQQRLERLETY